MDDLITWLRAQLDDDERIARACGAVPWVDDVPGMVHVDPAAIRDNKLAYGHLGYVVGAGPGEVGDAYRAHIARHAPARVLREVEAKRRLLDDFGGFFGLDDFSRGLVEHSFKLLALPFSDRPGYLDTWRP